MKSKRLWIENNLLNMERSCNKLNRNIASYNPMKKNMSNNNQCNPEIRVNHIWMEKNDRKGIKIIELNSSTDSSEEAPISNFSHAWSYVNNHAFQNIEEDDHRVNQDARRRRRVEIDDIETAFPNHYYYDCSRQTNNNSFYETYDSGINNTAHVKHQMNCFTIINNQNINSGSSSDTENYDTIEIIELDESVDSKSKDHVYNENVETYDPNVQSEQRMIWIYSYKNKRLLSDNNYELVNIPSKDISSTSTSYSISDEEQKTEKRTNACRAASPIPATYIPRLDLSLVQTLSTVTELSEHNKSQSKESSQEMINLKPRNNWLCDRNNKYYLSANSNVVNWMALSPRERRRRSINTNSDSSKENVMETEITHAEGIQQLDQSSLSLAKVEPSTIQVKADIHASEKETYSELHNTSNNASKTEEIKKISDILPINISFADVNSDDDKNEDIDYSNRPSIHINTKLNKTEITDPIEKLNCHNWITEEKVEHETTVHNYDLENAVDMNMEISSIDNLECDSASRRLWMKHMQLMKPPQWAEYLPITCSPPSLHLSISLSSLTSRKSWFKRLAKCVKCCK